MWMMVDMESEFTQASHHTVYNILLPSCCHGLLPKADTTRIQYSTQNREQIVSVDQQKKKLIFLGP